MFAVIDVETTGGSPNIDRVTEIAILLTDGEKILDQFTSLVNPQRKIDPFVTKLTGISDKMVADSPLFSDIAGEVERITKDAVFVAHNIGFDYGIIKREFRRIGKEFRRNNLCTVQLSQKAIKNQPSYSLGTLCENLGISLKGRHRAFGDAEATTMLLQKIIKENGMDYVINATNHNFHQIPLKGNLTLKMIDTLPEDPGVFRFLNKDGQILLIKSAKNIYKEVCKFLKEGINTFHYSELSEQIDNISHELINSHLISQLQEIQEIREHKPPFNKKSAYKVLPVGIFFSKKNTHQQVLSIDRNHNNDALWRFQQEKSAKRFLKRFLHKNNLNVSATPDNDNYYQKVNQVLGDTLYPNQNFFLIREVPWANIAYIVWIENYVYRGIGKIDIESHDRNIENLKDSIIPCENNTTSLKILQRYIRKKKTFEIVTY